jgi:hypothetical protein
MVALAAPKTQKKRFYFQIFCIYALKKTSQKAIEKSQKNELKKT